jgi:hypothetical protein
MTTSVEEAAYGHLLAALRANPAGPFAVLAALALLLRRPARALRVPTIAVAGVVLGLWLFELHRFSLI